MSEMIYPNVFLGKNPVIGPWCVLGKPPRGYNEGELELVIGDNAIIRPFTTIYAGVYIGDDLQTGQGASIRENNKIGDRVKVGTNCAIEFGNRIGDDVSIHSNCFMANTTLENNVVLAPNVVFTDDLHPACPRYLECLRGPTIRRGAKIGANSTILPGVTIGAFALIGAGSVVTGDIPGRSVAYGNPARVVKRIDNLVCDMGFFKHPYIWEADK